MHDDFKAGLEDVIAARSAICAIDGAAGRLYYRGYEIGELAGAVPFETVTALLARGFEVTGLDEHRSVPWEALPGRMVRDEIGEWSLAEDPERLPLSYTLRARKPAR